QQEPVTGTQAVGISIVQLADRCTWRTVRTRCGLIGAAEANQSGLFGDNRAQVASYYAGGASIADDECVAIPAKPRREPWRAGAITLQGLLPPAQLPGEVAQAVLEVGIPQVAVGVSSTYQCKCFWGRPGTRGRHPRRVWAGDFHWPRRWVQGFALPGQACLARDNRLEEVGCTRGENKAVACAARAMAAAADPLQQAHNPARRADQHHQ